MMNLSEMFKKPTAKPDGEFPELQDAVAEMIDLELDAPSIAPDHHDDHEAQAHEGESAFEASGSDGPRLTAYSQSRLAALKAFEDTQRSANEDLDLLSAALTRVNAAHHSTREFLSALHTSVYRANEMELAHEALVAENRKLTQQVEQVKRLRIQHESLIETYKRRETKMLQDADALRVDLGRAGLEANDAVNRISTLEAERAELLNTIAVKSSTAERHARENEILREKQINLSLDLENTQRRHTETERKFDELTSIRNAESAQLSDVRTKLSASEKEVHRLQKQHDAIAARLEEAQDLLSAAETEAEETAKRHENETQKLKSEIETLKARLEAAGKAQVESSDELGGIRQRLAELAAEKKIAEDRLAALKHDFESERTELLERIAQGEAGKPQAAAEQGEELVRLRDEVDVLRASIRKLAPYERMYKTVKERREKQAQARVEETEAPVARRA